MKIVWMLGAATVLCVFVSTNGAENKEVSSDKTEFSQSEKRAGEFRLTKLALETLARSIRSQTSLASRVLLSMEKWSGGRIPVSLIADVIEGVAARLHGFETATCGFFSDVGFSLGIPRQIAYQICNVALDFI